MQITCTNSTQREHLKGFCFSSRLLLGRYCNRFGAAFFFEAELLFVDSELIDDIRCEWIDEEILVAEFCLDYDIEYVAVIT